MNPLHKNPVIKQPKNEHYPTPKSLSRRLLSLGEFDCTRHVHEPAEGFGAITGVLREFWPEKLISSADIVTGTDFLTDLNYYPQIITNPPFSLVDDFVRRARVCCDKFAFIVPLNALSSESRWKRGTWRGLRKVWVFNRQVNYSFPLQEDGRFFTSGITTGWFVWERGPDKDFFETRIMDVSEDVVKISQKDACHQESG